MIKKILAFSALSLITLSSFANDIIYHATITHSDETMYGPETISSEVTNNLLQGKHYAIRVLAYNLKYDDKTAEKDRKHSFKEYNAYLIADMNLISLDKKNNIYKFKVTLRSIGLKYTGWGKIFQGGDVYQDGVVTLENGEIPVFYIDTVIGYDKYGNRGLFNLNNNGYFLLEGSYPHGFKGKPYMSVIRDLPITVKISNWSA